MPDNSDNQSTLPPMPIGGLVMILIGAAGVMIFV